MEKLKILRERAGLTQAECAQLIKSNAPLISNYENSVCLPDLEDAIHLENRFGERIVWDEKITPKEKFATIQSLIDLFQHYPIEMVVHAANRFYHRNAVPEEMIRHYAQLSGSTEEEPLMHPI